MAHHEACEVWIEQQIEAGLEAKKTKYAIGREIAKQIYDLFEVKIEPVTITRRAQRQAKKEIGTNVPTKPDDQEVPEKINETEDSKRPNAPNKAQEDKSLICIKCGKRKVKILTNGKPIKSKLCRTCLGRKAKPKTVNELKTSELPESVPELTADQKKEREDAWTKINQMMKDVVDFILGRELYPMIISKELKGRLELNLGRLNDFIKWDQLKEAKNAKR